MTETTTRAPYALAEGDAPQTGRLTFDTVECDRCDGEGRLWQHSRVAGGVCFKCNGVGKQRTRAAVKAAEALAAMKPEIAVHEMIPGDRVFESRRTGWVTVASVEVFESPWSSRAGKDFREGTHSVRVVYEGRDMRHQYAHDPDQPYTVQRRMTDEEWAAYKDAAREMDGVEVAE